MKYELEKGVSLQQGYDETPRCECCLEWMIEQGPDKEHSWTSEVSSESSFYNLPLDSCPVQSSSLTTYEVTNLSILSTAPYPSLSSGAWKGVCVPSVAKRNETSYLPLQPKALGRKLARFVQPFNSKVCAALKPAVSLHTSINIIKTILSFSTRWQEEKYDETPGWFFFKTPKKLAQEIPSKFVHTIQNDIKITQMDTRGAKKTKNCAFRNHLNICIYLIVAES